MTLRNCRKRWTIEKGGGRRSWRSVLLVWHDDDGDDDEYVITFILISQIHSEENRTDTTLWFLSNCQMIKLRFYYELPPTVGDIRWHKVKYGSPPTCMWAKTKHRSTKWSKENEPTIYKNNQSFQCCFRAFKSLNPRKIPLKSYLHRLDCLHLILSRIQRSLFRLNTKWRKDGWITLKNILFLVCSKRIETVDLH